MTKTLKILWQKGENLEEDEEEEEGGAETEEQSENESEVNEPEERRWWLLFIADNIWCKTFGLYEPNFFFIKISSLVLLYKCN